MNSPNWVRKMLEDNRKVIDMASGSNSITRMMEETRKLIDAGSGRDSIARMLEDNRKLMSSITHRPPLASMIGNATVSQVIGVPRVADLITNPVMPRRQWARLLDDLREVVGDQLHEDVAAEFQVAAEMAEQTEGDEWWVARLPLAVQLFLLLMVLQAVDKAGEFFADLTGADVPPAYRSATETLLYIGFALYAFIEVKAEYFNDDEG